MEIRHIAVFEKALSFPISMTSNHFLIVKTEIRASGKLLYQAFIAVTASCTAVLRMLVGKFALSAGSFERRICVARFSNALPIPATGNGSLTTHDQTAILARDHGEWVFVVDSDEPERTWKNADEALEELRREGWEVVQGPAPIRSSFSELEGLNRFQSWGYRLRRMVQ